MFQIAKPVTVVSLLAASYLVPSWQPSSRCTGPNCPLQQRQCAHPATVMLASPQVTTSPQLYDPDPLVLIEEPVHPGEPEDLVSPNASTEDVQAEIADDAKEENADETEAATAKDDPKTATADRDRDAAKTPRAAATRKVWMRASDARSLGLVPAATTGNSRGVIASGPPVAMAPTVAYRTVTYQQSYGCTGSGMQAFYGQPATYQTTNACSYGGCAAAGYYQSAAPAYRTRRVLFPNLFPRLRGLR